MFFKKKKAPSAPAAKQSFVCPHHRTQMDGDDTTMMIFIPAEIAEAAKIEEGVYHGKANYEGIDLTVDIGDAILVVKDAHPFVPSALAHDFPIELVGVTKASQVAWVIQILPSFADQE